MTRRDAAREAEIGCGDRTSTSAYPEVEDGPDCARPAAFGYRAVAPDSLLNGGFGEHADARRLTALFHLEPIMKSFFPFSSIAVATVLALCGAYAQADTVKIAIAGPMSGSVAQYGDMVKAGALTAIEQINAAGGAGGNKFEVVMMDDACEPKQAVA
ncbi:ABC transporter substrate-binding protein, partial [Burkholderia anthina]|uniref:ABC transporter substrate-binding protein n=1 Tax=Burkholderia anthina TaxID=179879 RepID=UPI001FC7C7F6